VRIIFDLPTYIASIFAVSSETLVPVASILKMEIIHSSEKLITTYGARGLFNGAFKYRDYTESGGRKGRDLFDYCTDICLEGLRNKQTSL
jgi:hypothetical protein